MCLDTRLTKMSVALAALFGTQTAQSASRSDELGHHSPVGVTTHNGPRFQFRGAASHKNCGDSSDSEFKKEQDESSCHNSDSAPAPGAERNNPQPEPDCYNMAAPRLFKPVVDNEGNPVLPPDFGMPGTAPPALAPGLRKYLHGPTTISTMAQTTIDQIEKTKNDAGSRPASTPDSDSDDGMPGTILPLIPALAKNITGKQTQKNAGYRIQKSVDRIMEDTHKKELFGDVPDYSVFDGRRLPRPNAKKYQKALDDFPNKIEEAMKKCPMKFDLATVPENEELKNAFQIYDVLGNARVRERTMVFDGWYDYDIDDKNKDEMLTFRVFDKALPQEALEVFISRKDAKKSKKQVMIYHDKNGEKVGETIYLKNIKKLQTIQKKNQFETERPNIDEKEMEELRKFLKNYEPELWHNINVMKSRRPGRVVSYM